MKIVCAVMCLCIFLVVPLTAYSFVATEADASVAISEAEQRVNVCFLAVAEAQNIGANTSQLLSVLEDAGLLLSKADVAFEKGDFDSAYGFAVQSKSRLDGVDVEAGSLRDVARQRNSVDFMFNVVGSSVVTLAVVVVACLVWFLSKRKFYDSAWARSLVKHAVPYFVVMALVALLAASPVIGKVASYPRTEPFTELWVLGSSHMAGDYPYGVSSGQNYSVFLGIGNQLGYCAYYVVEVKFRNETQSAPYSYGGLANMTPSSLPSLFNFTAFVADQNNWELPLTFSFDYVMVNDTALQVDFDRMVLNDVVLDLRGSSTAWDFNKTRFYGDLVFELWLFNSKSQVFQYHQRFVDLKLNMTAS